MSSRYQRISRLLDLPNKEQLQSHIFSQEQYFFSQKELQKLLLNPNSDSPFSLEIWDTNTILTDYQNNFNPKVKNRKLSAMENQALFDLTYYLPDDLLTKVDRFSMQYSIETRVPYLDHRLVEFALNLSPNLKYHEGETKYILKQVLYQYIPKKLFDRPKQGFSIPLNKWLKKELSYLIDEYLSHELVSKLGLVNNLALL
jgi:asparagine synthase (glutamine-hydrolysing)